MAATFPLFGQAALYCAKAIHCELRAEPDQDGQGLRLVLHGQAPIWEVDRTGAYTSNRAEVN